jgi:hypothetical protein
MAVRALTDAFVYVGGHDFTGDSNAARIAAEAERLETQTFGSSGWKTCIGGLKDVAAEIDGFAQYGATDVDPEVFNNLGVSQVFTVADVETEDEVAYMFQAAHYSYEQFGQLGVVAPFSVKGQGKDGVGLVQGQLAKARGTVGATGATGTALELGAASSSQFLYATFHVFSAGTTITAVVESDEDNTFGSATTRITFGPITAAGGTWGTRVAGAITDTWYRLRVTAITGSFSIACAVGIQ